LVKTWALLQRRRDEVRPEDVQDLARYILGHRLWLGPHAAGQGVTVENVIDDIIAKVPVP
jgi:MoxR-like ATPase